MNFDMFTLNLFFMSLIGKLYIKIDLKWEGVSMLLQFIMCMLANFVEKFI